MSIEVLAQKIALLQRCVARSREELANCGADFRSNHSAQDAAVLNVIRACDTTIDLANMPIRKRLLGILSESRESLQMLIRDKRLDADLGARQAVLR
jgi:hypothetical protein